MPDLSNIPDAELLFDRQECFNDLILLTISKMIGNEHPEHDMRISGNLRQLEIIRLECKRRRFDPAIYDQAKEKA